VFLTICAIGSVLCVVVNVCFLIWQCRQYTKAGTPSASHNNARNAICPKCGSKNVHSHCRSCKCGFGTIVDHRNGQTASVA